MLSGDKKSRKEQKQSGKNVFDDDDDDEEQEDKNCNGDYIVSQDKKSRKEQKKSGRNKKLSRLFASDCEDELQSVVSDNPNLYNRSISMVRFYIIIV